MNLDYHIPMPHLEPTKEELEWAKTDLMPHAQVALDKLYEKYGAKFDKANLDQAIFDNSLLGKRMKDHVEELELGFRRFCLFIGYKGAHAAKPHCDAHKFDIPMIARLNVPIQGIVGAKISWWKTGVEDPKMLERKFEQWNSKTQRMERGFSYLAGDGDWGEPVHVEQDPGPCWNHVDKAHKLDLDDIQEHRVNITVELEPQISWIELVERLDKKGYLV